MNDAFLSPQGSGKLKVIIDKQKIKVFTTKLCGLRLSKVNIICLLKCKEGVNLIKVCKEIIYVNKSLGAKNARLKIDQLILEINRIQHRQQFFGQLADNGRACPE